MNNKSLVIYSIVLIGVSVAMTRHFWPSLKLETRVEQKEVVKTRIVTQIREVVRPDGSTEKITTVTDNSEETRRRTDTKTEKAPSAWLVGVGAATEWGAMSPVYNLQVSRRLFGPFFAGVSASKDQAGLIISAEF